MMKMKKDVFCAGCPLVSRRKFLTGCVGATAAAAVSGLSGIARAGESEKTRVKIVFALHGPRQTGPDWPNKGFNFAPVMKWAQAELARRCPGIVFETAMANGPKQAQALADADKADPPDGYLVWQMNCWNRVAQTFAATGKPVLYVDFLYGGSGGFLVYTAAFLRQGAKNVAFMASSDIDDVAAAARCFRLCRKGGSPEAFVQAVSRVRLARTPKPGDLECAPDPVRTISPEECARRLRETRILAVRDQTRGALGKIGGIEILKIPFAELNEAWEKADKDEARAIAQRWAGDAQRVEGVSEKTLEESAAMYLAQRALIKRYGARAITVNCLGGFYGNHIHAYPCLGFHQLLNENLVGGCECDLRSTSLIVMIQTLTEGRPGYISDPVLDIGRRQIIYAHCVATNRPFGPSGPANPYEIVTHSEDRQGASVRSLLPQDYKVTTMQIAPDRKEILLHQAKTRGNDFNDRACRTKLCAEPIGDIEKMFRFWDRWGWHRVTFYGDLKEPARALADVLGWRMIEEA